MNPIYRNLIKTDTLFGLELVDLIILVVAVNLIFRIHPADDWMGKILNYVVIIVLYFCLHSLKRRYPKGHFKQMMNYLFKPRLYVPMHEDGQNE